MTERPADILEIGVGELVAIVAGITGLGIGLAIAENFREWFVRLVDLEAGWQSYAGELAFTIFATILGGLWGVLVSVLVMAFVSWLAAGWIARRTTTGGQKLEP